MEESNEVLKKVCDVRRKFDELVQRHSDDTNFTDSVTSAIDDAGFRSEKEIASEYNRVADRDSLLRIGIVGAVKAGKSSLLNSLFFGGKDILPKAATPMTAAQTEITFGNEPSVTVYFFTDEDIEDLKRQSERYERQLNEIRNRRVKELQEKWLSDQKQRDPMFSGIPSAKEREEWEKFSSEDAKTELSESKVLCAAYDQYQKIMRSQRKKGIETFKVDSIDEISGRLEQYVGANGRYMPFTSRVRITLPSKSLMGVEIVDTPGFDDPVQSRDKCAEDAIRNCHVVFILSRADQFLPARDNDVLQKITKTDYIRYIYILSSQVDNSLGDSEGNLPDELKSIKEELSDVVSSNLSKINWRGVFDQLIDDPSERMFLVSGICASMADTFAERDSWDEDRKKLWKKLCRNYPDYFSDSEDKPSIKYLKELGNTGKVLEAIEYVKSRKDEVFSQFLEHFEKKYADAAATAKKKIIRQIEVREDEINTNDIGRMESKIHRLQQSCDSVGPALNDVFKESVSEWYDSVQSWYQNKLSELKYSVKDAMKGEIIRKSGFFTDSVTVHARAIKNAIYDYIDEYNASCPHFFMEQMRKLTNKVIESVQGAWKEKAVAEDEQDTGFPNRIRSAMAAIVRDYDLKYHLKIDSQDNYGGSSNGDPLPFVFSSILEGDEAEEFIERSKDVVSTLNRKFMGAMKDAIDDVYRRAMSYDFSKIVLAPYIGQLENRKKDMERPRLALEKLKSLKEEVESIK